MPDDTLDALLKEYLVQKLGKGADSTSVPTESGLDVPSDGSSEIVPPAEVAVPVQQKRELLTAAYQRYSVSQEFQPGQHVKWKPGLRNRLLPNERDPAVVLEVLTEPILDPAHNSGSPYFRECLNLRLGVLGDDGEFQVYFYDSRRFEAF